MGYGNPVPGRILPPKAPRTGTQFIVTRTCQDHRNSGQGCALDIWNGRDNQDPASAMEAGRVVYRYDPEGIVRILHPNGERTDYAHMRGIVVAFNQQVSRGQKLGLVSDAHSASIPNFSGPHLHTALVRLINGVWVEVDLWSRLDQNLLPDSGTGGVDVPSPMKVYTPFQITLGGLPMWLVNGLVPVYDAPNRGAGVIYKLTPGIGTLFSPGTVPGTPEEFYTYWDVPKGRWLYIYKQNVTMARPLTADGGGYTQAELDAAVDRAEAAASQQAAGSVAAAAVTEAKKFT